MPPTASQHPRILILSASVGAGHVRAAEALERAFHIQQPGAFIRHLDILTLTSAIFRRVYAKAYLDLARHAPHLLGYLYDLTDIAPSAETSRRGQLQRLVERANTRKLLQLIDEPPGFDAIVCTHFLPADLLSQRELRGTRHAPTVIVVTDFDAHAFWAVKGMQRYCVATREAQLSLMHWGIAPELIDRTGIPIDPVFAEPLSQYAARRALGLNPQLPCVLLLAGGFGVGPIERALVEVLKTQRELQVVAVAGKNTKLRQALDRTPVPARHRCTVLGYTDQMPTLLAAADIAISKPGGLTTSEALARSCALAIMNPIPGQESRNSDMLLEAGAAIKINNLSSLKEKLETLLSDPQRLARLRAQAASIATPEAAFAVARRVIAEISTREHAQP